MYVLSDYYVRVMKYKGFVKTKENNYRNLWFCQINYKKISLW